MEKSADAFRTISEVAQHLDTPAHVLRFWESRFPQIKPVKRAGGRRYYRPSDVALLVGIRRLLHDEGMTIRGVQKILREQGVRHVAGLAEDMADVDVMELEADVIDTADEPPAPEAEPEPEPVHGRAAVADPDPALDALIAQALAASPPATGAFDIAPTAPAPAAMAEAPAVTVVAPAAPAAEAAAPAPEAMAVPAPAVTIVTSGAPATAAAAPAPTPAAIADAPAAAPSLAAAAFPAPAAAPAPATTAAPPPATVAAPAQRPAAVPEQMPLFPPADEPKPPAPEEAEAEPLANRLRHLRRAQMAPRRTELRALANRLARLRDKLANPPTTPRS